MGRVVCMKWLLDNVLLTLASFNAGVLEGVDMGWLGEVFREVDDLGCRHKNIPVVGRRSWSQSSFSGFAVVGQRRCMCVVMACSSERCRLEGPAES